VIVEGVFKILGVFEKPFCAGDGVMFTKSAKSKFCEGVFGAPKPEENMFGVPNAPGVFITEDGSAMFFGGGVEGGCMRRAVDGFAGEGDVAR